MSAEDQRPMLAAILAKDRNGEYFFTDRELATLAEKEHKAMNDPPKPLRSHNHKTLLSRGESLLRGTEAIARSTLEMVEYRHQWLVRLRDAEGVTYHRLFPRHQTDEAFALFLEWSERLRNSAHTEKEK